MMKHIIDGIHHFLANCKGETYAFYKYHWYRARIPFRVWKIRRKEHIRVLFVVSEISMWKTETLYQLMLSHSRFYPMILPVGDITKNDAHKEVVKYCCEKGYDYVLLDDGETIQSKLSPDIIFYQQAYPKFIDDKYFEMNNRESLFCHVNYCFQNTITSNSLNRPLQNIAWMVFSENEICAKEIAPIMDNKGCNLKVTGLPFMDELLLDKNAFQDPWKYQDTPKKRIIYAPHHSFMPEDLVSFASFLDNGEFILRMAKKYSESTQWVFKPHPFLEPKLRKIWGDEKTDCYFEAWRTLPNTQIVDGGYYGVFKHSDAMLHDCGSFLLEYQYTGNPVMFLHSSQPHKNVRLNTFSETSKDLHYQAYENADIERFIQMVIAGKDPMREKRLAFFQEFFVPPHGKTASENIIDAILGKSKK